MRIEIKVWVNEYEGKPDIFECVSSVSQAEDFIIDDIHKEIERVQLGIKNVTDDMDDDGDNK